MRSPLKETPGTNLYLALLLVFMAMYAITTAFEEGRQWFYPENVMWQISLLMVFLVSVGAAVIAFFPFQALIRTEARLDTLLNGSPALQFVVDTDHRILSWNRALEHYSGMKESEVLGTTDQWKAFYPDKRPCLSDLLIDAVTRYSIGSADYIPGVVRYVNNPANLTDPGIAVTGVLKDHSGKKICILFDSISTLLIYLSSSNISKFIHFVTNKLRLLDVSGIFLATEKGLDPQLETQLTTFVDVVIEDPD
ncbi:MAG: PAS domain S-box protein [Methanoregulaceae archaeon]